MFGQERNPRYTHWLAVLAISALSSAGCHNDSIVEVGPSELNRTVTVALGSEFALTLQTVGPGEFATPPELSSRSLRFIGVEYVDPVPAGPTQRFTFAAVTRGTSVVVFRHTATDRVVRDTVVVK